MLSLRPEIMDALAQNGELEKLLKLSFGSVQGLNNFTELVVTSNI
jgi:hypothetical protein